MRPLLVRIVAFLVGSAGRLGLVLVLLAVPVTGAFALLQTSIGLDTVGRMIARMVSAPGYQIEITGLEGTVPFDVSAKRITVADAGGVWLAFENVRLDIALGQLLGFRLHIRELSAAALDLYRAPDIPAAAEPEPWSERLRIPTMPVATTIDRFAIDRVALAETVLGESIAATVAGHAVSREDAAEIALRLHRTDGVPGEFDLSVRQSGVAPDMRVRLAAREPSGVLLAKLLGRDDRPPLSVSIAGDGPVSDWHGRLDASAGDIAHAAANIALALGRESTLSLNGTAAVAKLLPPELAALTGDSVPVAAHLTLREDGAIAVEALTLGLSAGRLTADAVVGRPDRGIAAHVAVSLSDLEAASALVGEALRGSAELHATVSGSEDRPRIRIEISGDALGIAAFEAAQGRAQAAVSWSAETGDPAARLLIAADGELRGVVLPEGMPRDLGRDLRWSLAASAKTDFSLVELTELTARGIGIDVAGTGRIAEYGSAIDGKMRVVVAELGALSGLVGHRIDGRLTLDLTAEQQADSRMLARINGSVAALDTGIPAANALAGRSVTIAGSAERDRGGVFRLDRLAVTGDELVVGASGHFDPGSMRLAGRLDADIGDLRRAAAALDLPVAGRLTAAVTVEGAIARPLLHARLDGRDLRVGTAAFDRVRLEAKMADATQKRAAIDGEFHSGGLDGSLSLVADAGDAKEVAIRDLLLKAAGGVVNADLRIDRKTMLTRGKMTARLPDLSPWSRVAGVPLAGRLDVTAGLDAREGQGVELKLAGERLAHGGGESRIALDRMEATARLDEVLGTPYGKARATLTGVTFAAGGVSNATVTLDSPKPGRFAFRAEAKGRVVENLNLAADGTGEFAPQTGAVELRLARLDLALGPDRFRLSRPLTIARRGDDLALTGLAATFGRGRISGEAARRGNTLSLRLAAQDLPVASLGRLAGYPQASGALAFEAAIDGPLAAPRGRFSLSGRSLRLAAARQERLPALALDLAGGWNGSEIDLNGRVAGIKGETLTLTGSVPLVLDAQTLAIAVPQHGRVALRVHGAGDIANLADLLPLGEDRLGGRFALDGAVNGTVAAPAASGHLTVANGRYENFATGAVLNDLRLDIVGDRDRLAIREFSARDSARGSLTAQGGVALGSVGGPTADISVTLKDFRIIGRDLAVAAASGTVAITGPLASPHVAARLATDQGEINLPASLPPSVTRLDVVEINGRGRARAGRAGATKTAPALPASLDIRVAVPGRIFVRGRGLDSEWRGQLAITGTSEAPQIAGSLEAIRGTFDVLGKTFRVTHGEIGFDGGAAIDPVLDITAEVTAADITAQVMLQGPVSAPKLTMTSSPVVPQDEILARVLFGRGLGQITVAEGLQVAAAAGSLAGGGFDVLDRLRGGLGLDRLGFGSAANGMLASNPKPGNGGATSGAAITAGKYIADGVYVGASQGLTPRSSKAIVEVEILPRVTIQGDVSQSGGTGIGLNYKYDY
ncbi:MAG: translocation/assembly module TamB domain-containing protein [Alphaproteobacteria bacterium]